MFHGEMGSSSLSVLASPIVVSLIAGFSLRKASSASLWRGRGRTGGHIGNAESHALFLSLSRPRSRYMEKDRAAVACVAVVVVPSTSGDLILLSLYHKGRVVWGASHTLFMALILDHVV